MSGQKPREIAVRVLQRRREGDFIDHLLESALADASLSSADRHLCQELIYGIVRWQATLDWLVSRKTGGRQQKPMLQILLQLGLYQIFFLDRIPPHAAVNETVELARQSGFGPQSGFINAVLRGYLREAEVTRALLQELKSTQPETGFSQPRWLIDRWESRWGAAQSRSLLEWNNSRPATYARVNLLKTDSGALLSRWRDEGVDYSFTRFPWCAENTVFELKSHPPLHSLKTFNEGLFYIQDPSTLLAPTLLDPQPGQAILDMCAAPGGKLAFLAQLVNNQASLVARDISEERLQMVRENCARLGAVVKTSTPPALASDAAFDRILIDAPCSNTGVLRRRVDLRWRIRREEIERLRQEQLDLLAAAAKQLKTGGVLVYSTCSLEPEENSSVVREFLSRQVWFKLDQERELVPFNDGVDGAYAARLIRT